MSSRRQILFDWVNHSQNIVSLKTFKILNWLIFCTLMANLHGLFSRSVPLSSQIWPFLSKSVCLIQKIVAGESHFLLCWHCHRQHPQTTHQHQSHQISLQLILPTLTYQTKPQDCGPRGKRPMHCWCCSHFHERNFYLTSKWHSWMDWILPWMLQSHGPLPVTTDGRWWNGDQQCSYHRQTQQKQYREILNLPPLCYIC